MITEGGEAAFVRKMVQESLVYQERCQYVMSALCSTWLTVCLQVVHFHAGQTLLGHRSRGALAGVQGMQTYHISMSDVLTTRYTD